MRKKLSKKMDLKSYLKVPSFNEFVVKLNKPVKEINQKLLEKEYHWWI